MAAELVGRFIGVDGGGGGGVRGGGGGDDGAADATDGLVGWGGAVLAGAETALVDAGEAGAFGVTGVVYGGGTTAAGATGFGRAAACFAAR